MAVRIYVRRAQRMGRFTISVTLPKDWIRSTGIKPGDLLSMHVRDDGSLVVSPGPPGGLKQGTDKVARTINADACGGPGILSKILVALYISGADEISFVSGRGLSDEQMREIRRATAALKGASVFEESRERVVVNVFVDSTSSQVSRIFNRMHELTVGALKDILGALRGGDEEGLRRAAGIDKEVDSNYWLAARQLLLAANRPELLRNIGLESTRQIPGFRTVAKALDDAGKAVAAAAADLLHGADGRASDLAGHTEAILGLYRRSFESWSKMDAALANVAVEEAMAVRRRLRDAAALTAGSAAAISYLYDMAQVAASSGTVAEMAVNRSIIESPNPECAPTASGRDS